MTVTYGFYDSISSDRLYNAKQFGSIFDGIIEDGVYAGIGEKLMVTEDSPASMDVIIGSGRAWFNHTWTLNDADLSKTIATADALLDRIDVVYLEINEDSGTRANSFGVLTGTPASTPIAPTLTQTASIHQYPLAHIYVGAAVTSIVQGNITNKVGLTETPFVAGIIDYVTTSELVAQWEAQWDQWFQDIIDQLSTEAETNLQNQIWDLAGVVSGAPPYATDMVTLNTHDHSSAPGNQISAGGIGTGAVTESKIGSGAVTNTKIGSLAVDAAKLASNAVTESKIASLAVTNGKLASSAVTESKIASGAVTNAKIASNAIDTTQIVNEAVTAAKIDNRTRRIGVGVSAMKETGNATRSETYETYYDSECIVLSYNDNSDALFAQFAMPKDHVPGTSITLRVLWHRMTGAPKCRFTASIFISYDGGAAGASGGENIEGTSSYIAINNDYAKMDNVGNFSTNASYEVTNVNIKFGRNTTHADDYDEYCGILGLFLEYTADS